MSAICSREIEHDSQRTTLAVLKKLAMKGTIDMSIRPNIVLVHGAWADGSCWTDVIERLQADGYTVTAPQFPESSLADDVARLRQVLHRQDGATVVAGHF